MTYPRAVVALAGARDYYQLPLALHEDGLLEKLVTDLYWPADKKWFSSSLGAILPEDLVAARFREGLGAARVKISASAMCAFAMMKASPTLKLNRFKDKAIGRKARQVAASKSAALFCYSTYASEAFRNGKGASPRHRFLFLLQADPRTRRRILLEEMERAPFTKESLLEEYEFCLPEAQFESLCDEPQLANGWVTASSYAAQTIADYGIPRAHIHIVPYGVDSKVFIRRTEAPDASKPLQVAFMGKLTQAKGLTYLFEAMRLLKHRNIRLTLFSRAIGDRNLLSRYGDLDLEIKLGLSGRRLAYELHKVDVCAFPNLSEGFAHVILEAMSCGVPVIATTHSCAPDVMTSGVHGFILPIRDARAIAEKLDWGMDHRGELAAMGEAAAAQARLFTWERFRQGVRYAYKKMIDTTARAHEGMECSL